MDDFKRCYRIDAILTQADPARSFYESFRESHWSKVSFDFAFFSPAITAITNSQQGNADGEKQSAFVIMTLVSPPEWRYRLGVRT